MATVPFRDFGNARGEMDRLFAEMPGAPAALVPMVATRGRLGCVGPRDDLSRAADAMNEPAGLEALPRRRRRPRRRARAACPWRSGCRPGWRRYLRQN